MNALISVFDKTGIVNFARFLSSLGINLISTGATYEQLVNSGLLVSNVEKMSAFKKPINSIVKLLYPEIYAGVSADRSNILQMNQLESSNIDTIDFVIINPVSLKQYFKNKSVFPYDCLEHIDIGGLTILRSAAKNYKDIVVVCDPHDYPQIIDELKSNKNISLETKKYLMKKVFEITANYDRMLLNHLAYL